MSPRTLAFALTLPALALCLGGCFTPRVKPQPSKAVLEAEARGRHEVKVAPTCPDLTSPQAVDFGFEEGKISDLDAAALDRIAAALKCHPAATALVVGQADGHGTEAEQKTLASGRAQAVVAELTGRGVPAGRIATQVQVQGTPPTGDAQRLVVLAEGRRW